MRPLTLEKPKPLLKVGNQTLLEHIIDALPKEVDELILVIGYKGEQIQKFLGEKFNGCKVQYVWQKEKLGTADALMRARHLLGNEKFLMLYADDIHGEEGLKRLVGYDLALVTAQVEDPRRFGVVLHDNHGRILEIEEKPENPKSNTVSAGAMILDGRIFNYKPSRHPNGEYYLTTMLDQLIKEHNVFAAPASLWISTATPEDLKKAERILKTSKPAN